MEVEKIQPKFVGITEQTKEVKQQKETKGDNEFMSIEKPDKILFTLVAKGKKNKEIDSITQKSMESARIQSFPDSFEVLGTRGSQYKQVGNAVPPMLSNIIAEQIKTLLL